MVCSRNRPPYACWAPMSAGCPKRSNTNPNPNADNSPNPIPNPDLNRTSAGCLKMTRGRLYAGIAAKARVTRIEESCPIDPSAYAGIAAKARVKVRVRVTVNVRTRIEESCPIDKVRVRVTVNVRVHIRVPYQLM